MAKKPNGELISLRVDAEFKYLVDLASRKDRRTITSYVEKAVEIQLQKDGWLDTDLWQINELERILSLADYDIKLLTYDERVLHDSMVVRGIIQKKDIDGKTVSFIEKAILKRIERDWENFKAKAFKDDPKDDEYFNSFIKGANNG